MYAAAIWDKAERCLTLARDPLGIKPLYLTQQQGGLAFASEIRALRVLPEHMFDLDERAVHDFFSFGHVQRPRSIFRQVRSLEPGHVLRIGAAGEPAIRAFWKPRFRVAEGRSEADWIAETRDRVQRTVERHMLADVTVGAFLSGGVDSSAITAAMTRVATAPVKAFTVGFPGTSIDETASAARIARHLGCEHIVLPLEPEAAGDLLPAVQAAFDEPCAATAAVPIWHLSRLAAEHVKVVLCGEGSDEIFAGYKRQRTAMAAARWAPLLRTLGPIAGLADALPGASSRWNYLRQNARRFQRLRDAGEQLPALLRRHPDLVARHPRAPLRARLPRPAGGAARPLPGWRRNISTPRTLALDPLQQFMLADITVHMPGSLLNRLDRASMAHSLEARVPFLSHDFVDWSLTMPEDMKLHGKTGKYALRQGGRAVAARACARHPQARLPAALRRVVPR